MNLSTTHEENFVLINVLDTRLDASLSPGFRKEVEEIIDTEKKHILLDISALKFMDSSTLGAMVGILKAMKDNKKLIIIGASGVVLELFTLTRMDRVFTLAADYDDAKTKIAE